MQQKYGTHLDTRVAQWAKNIWLATASCANEVTSWEDLIVDSLEIAKDLWEQTRPKSSSSDAEIGAAGTELIDGS